MHITCLALVPYPNFPHLSCLEASQEVGHQLPRRYLSYNPESSPNTSPMPVPYTKIHSKKPPISINPSPPRHCSSWCRNFLEDAEPGVQGKKIHQRISCFFSGTNWCFSPTSPGSLPFAQLINIQDRSDLALQSVDGERLVSKNIVLIIWARRCHNGSNSLEQTSMKIGESMNSSNLQLRP